MGRRLAALWPYRHLLFNLVGRDVKLRYQGTVFGFIWCLLNPLLMTGIFTLLFTVFMQNPSIPRFPLFALIGILAWNFHASAIMGAIPSITNNASLIEKAYFPREILPLAIVLSNAVNFLFSLPVLLVLLLLYGTAPTWSLLLLPIPIVLQVVFLVGAGLLIAAMNVFYRDTGVIAETLMLAWFFLTPVFYQPQNLFPEWQRVMYIVNPVASIIAIYRDILYGGAAPEPAFLLRTTGQVLLLLMIGWNVFQRVSDRFVEEL